MPGFTYSTRALMVVPAFIAAMTAGLMQSTELWAFILYALSLATLTASGLFLMVRRDAFWFAFTILGWGYFVFVNGAFHTRPVDVPIISPLLDALYQAAFRATDRTREVVWEHSATQPLGRSSFSMNGVFYTARFVDRTYLKTAHSAFSLLLAFAGGVAAQTVTFILHGRSWLSSGSSNSG